MPSRISVMLTACSVAPSARITSRSRSWVIGRAGRTPCCSKAMAAASTAPIQIGRYRSPCVSLSSKIGWFPGSSTRTPTTRSSCTVRLPQLPPGGDGRTVLSGTRRTGRRGSPTRRPTCSRYARLWTEEISEARLQQGGVQLRGERREFPQLLRGARPGLLRARPQQRRHQLLDQPRLPVGAVAVAPQVPRLDAMPRQPRRGPRHREVGGRVPPPLVRHEQAELHAVGQLLQLQAGRAGELLRGQG